MQGSNPSRRSSAGGLLGSFRRYRRHSLPTDDKETKDKDIHPTESSGSDRTPPLSPFLPGRSGSISHRPWNWQTPTLQPFETTRKTSKVVIITSDDFPVRADEQPQLDLQTPADAPQASLSNPNTPSLLLSPALPPATQHHYYNPGRHSGRLSRSSQASSDILDMYHYDTTLSVSSSTPSLPQLRPKTAPPGHTPGMGTWTSTPTIDSDSEGEGAEDGEELFANGVQWIPCGTQKDRQDPAYAATTSATTTSTTVSAITAPADIDFGPTSSSSSRGGLGISHKPAYPSSTTFLDAAGSTVSFASVGSVPSDTFHTSHTSLPSSFVPLPPPPGLFQKDSTTTRPHMIARSDREAAYDALDRKSASYPRAAAANSTHSNRNSSYFDHDIPEVYEDDDAEDEGFQADDDDSRIQSHHRPPQAHLHNPHRASPQSSIPPHSVSSSTQVSVSPRAVSSSSGASFSSPNRVISDSSAATSAFSKYAPKPDRHHFEPQYVSDAPQPAPPPAFDVLDYPDASSYGAAGADDDDEIDQQGSRRHPHHYSQQRRVPTLSEHKRDSTGLARSTSARSQNSTASRLSSVPMASNFQPSTLRTGSGRRRYSVDEHQQTQTSPPPQQTITSSSTYPHLHMHLNPPANVDSGNTGGAAAFLSGKEYLRNNDVVPRVASAFERSSLPSRKSLGTPGVGTNSSSLWDDLEAVKAKLRKMKLSQGLPVGQSLRDDENTAHEPRRGSGGASERTRVSPTLAFARPAETANGHRVAGSRASSALNNPIRHQRTESSANASGHSSTNSTSTINNDHNTSYDSAHTSASTAASNASTNDSFSTPQESANASIASGAASQSSGPRRMYPTRQPSPQQAFMAAQQYRTAGERHLAEVLGYARRAWLAPDNPPGAGSEGGLTTSALMLERVAHDVLALYDTLDLDDEDDGDSAQVDALDKAALSLAGFLLQYLNQTPRGSGRASNGSGAGLRARASNASIGSVHSSGSSSGHAAAPWAAAPRNSPSPTAAQYLHQGHAYGARAATSSAAATSTAATATTPRVPRASAAMSVLGTPAMSSTPAHAAGKDGRAAAPRFQFGARAHASSHLTGTPSIASTPGDALFEYDLADYVHAQSPLASYGSTGGAHAPRRGSTSGLGPSGSLSGGGGTRRGASTTLGYYGGGLSSSPSGAAALPAFGTFARSQSTSPQHAEEQEEAAAVAANGGMRPRVPAQRRYSGKPAYDF